MPIFSISILGAGILGTALARRFTTAGHRVLVGSSDGRTGLTYADAAMSSDLVALAVPWPHCLGVVAATKPLRGKILIDCTNPETPDGRALEIGHTTSGAEQIARLVPEAYVVKAFNALYAEILACETRFEATPSVLFCGDDPRARDCVAGVIASCGFDPVDAGPLVNARHLEPLAILTVQLVRVQGWGPTGMAWRIARPVSVPVKQETV